MTPADLFDEFTRLSIPRDPEAFLDLFTDDGELILPFASWFRTRRMRSPVIEAGAPSRVARPRH